MTIVILRRLLAAALAAAPLVLVGCSASRPAGNSSVTFGPGTGTATPSITAPAIPVSGSQITVDGFAFAPTTLTIHVGDAVTWTNRDVEPTVAASDGSFHSPGMGTGATFSHTFSAAGEVDYVCSIHPMMRGTVVVTG